MSRKLKDEAHMSAMAKSKSKRMEKSESERDSGFSDASSEHLSAIDQTDADEAPCSVGPAGAASRSPLAAVVGGGALQGLSPMIIMNNVVLKQSKDSSPSLKPWSFSPAVEVVQPQVVFLQPMVPQRTVAKGPPPKRRRHKKYLPILKSYPKIAPHPGDSQLKGGSSSRSSSSSSSSTKSSSSSQLDCSPTDQQLSASTREPSSSAPPSSVVPHNTSADSDAASSLHSEKQTSLRPESTDGSPAPTPPPRTAASNSRSVSASGTDNKLKRFCNTYNILSKSGLLDITLRTKELIRQNRRTQTELERLREHTSLFLQALQTGDSAVWSRLHMSMQEEGKSKAEPLENLQILR